jgi:hypothetical protein
MIDDPAGALALARIIELSRDVEEQLTARRQHGTRPLQAVLAKARRRGAHALAALAEVAPHDQLEITRLQNEVRIFGDLVAYLREMVAAGLDAEAQIDDAERDELERLIAPPDDRAHPEQMAEYARLGIGAPHET